MNTPHTPRPNTAAVPAFSKKDQAAISALIESYSDDETDYARQDAELKLYRAVASARACRRIAAKIRWMILDDDQEISPDYPEHADKLDALADWYTDIATNTD